MAKIFHNGYSIFLSGCTVLYPMEIYDNVFNQLTVVGNIHCFQFFTYKHSHGDVPVDKSLRVSIIDIYDVCDSRIAGLKCIQALGVFLLSFCYSLIRLCGKSSPGLPEMPLQLCIIKINNDSIFVTFSVGFVIF
jgi:hypothetical protein